MHSEPPGAEAPVPVQRALDHLLDFGEVYVWIADLTPRTVWVSPSWLRFTHRDAERDFITSWGEHVHPDDRGETLKRLREAVASRTTFESEYRIQRVDGAWRRMHTRGTPFAGADGEVLGYVGVNHDITELREQEQRLRVQQAQHQDILDNVHAVVWVIDGQGRYRFVNRGWERSIGRPREWALGRHFREVLPREFADQMERPVADVFATGERTVNEPVLMTNDGPRTFLAERVLLRDLDGVSPLVCGIATDITELRRAEQARAESDQRAHQTQRLESLGLMAGGIAHDFNNLLTGVLGNTELALDGLPADSPAADRLRHVQRAATRAAELARQMLAFVGRTPVALRPLDPGRLVEEMTDLLADAVGERSVLTLDVSPDVPNIEGDRVLLEQVVLNLVKNAQESYERGPGPVTVAVGRTNVATEPPLRFVDGHACPAGDYVEISVTDAGTGIAPESIARIFDPFYTTKFAGRGLGLASVLGTVRVHGGGIRVDSRVGRGSTFRVLLPVATPRSPAAAGPPTVLIVDDEPAIRDLARAALQGAGFDIVLAANAREALAAWNEHGGALDLVIADLSLAGTSGGTLLGQLRTLDADLPLVAMSGYETGRGAFRAGSDAHTRFIGKPFRIEQLIGAASIARRQPA